MGIVHKYRGNFEWDGVAVKEYVTGEAVGATRRVLIGAEESAQNFAVRYFEIPPGGVSALDNHAHDHGVFILRGRARVLLGNREVEVGHGDVVYIPPHETHQFRVIGDEPLGFICVVSGKRE